MFTRTDIYSLGVLLYELLAGTTPFDKERLHRVAYDEVRRIIREEEPPRPSKRLSTLGDTLGAVSAHRKTEPKRLTAAIRDDLDWIVMKSLEKDRTRRYETASSVADDVLRHLNNEPIEARPPSTLYRMRKFARRHKTVVLIAGSVAFLSAFMLITGIVAGVISEQGDQKRLEEKVAQIQTMCDDANGLIDSKQLGPAEEKYRNILSACRHDLASTHMLTLQAMDRSADICERQERWDSACEFYELAFDWRRGNLGVDNLETRHAAVRLCRFVAELSTRLSHASNASASDVQRAMTLANRGIEVAEISKLEKVFDFRTLSMIALAQSQMRGGRPEEALKTLNQTHVMWSVTPWILRSLIDTTLGERDTVRDWYAAAAEWLPKHDANRAPGGGGPHREVGYGSQSRSARRKHRRRQVRCNGSANRRDGINIDLSREKGHRFGQRRDGAHSVGWPVDLNRSSCLPHLWRPRPSCNCYCRVS